VKNLAEGDNDDDIDLFGSDDEEEDAEAIRIREERLTGKYFRSRRFVLFPVQSWNREAMRP